MSRSMMALIRGTKSLWPCPVCLVPKDKLSDTMNSHPRRTSSQSQAILAAAREKGSAEEKEGVLKQYGLRDVEVRISVLFLCWLTLP